MLNLAVAPLAKTLELTLDSMEHAAREAINGVTEHLDAIEQALAQSGAEGLRPSAQFAKLVTALMWLNRTEEACKSMHHQQC